MSDLNYDSLQKGDIVLYARVLPKVGYYELLELKLNIKDDQHCVGVESTTKRSYIFSRSLAEQVLFINRRAGIDYLDEKKLENKNVKVAKE